MRLRILTAAFAIVVVACGGDEPASTDTSADVTSTVVAATQASTDTTATTAAPASTATTAAPETTTTTEAMEDPALTAALAAAGTYAGSWTNTTFGSTGDAGLTMTVSDSGDVTMEWDLGGFVFGATDPGAESQNLNVADLVGGRIISTDLFGEIEVAVSDDFSTITMDAEAVPTAGIQAFRATATISADGTISGTYVVEFDGGAAPAEGTFEMTRG